MLGILSRSIVCFLTLSTSLTMAQSSGINLTVTFSDPEPGTCANTTQGQGITFSTYMVPHTSVCFNLDDLFAENNHSGAIQQGLALQSQPTNFSWSAFGNENYNARANYSQLWYQQENVTEKIGAGQDAARQFSVYSGRDCHSINGSESRTLEPWFGWTCQSEVGGQCDQVPISIQSFLIADAGSINRGYPKCWDAALMGQASTPKMPSLQLLGIMFLAMILIL